MSVSRQVIKAALYGPEAKKVDIREPNSSRSHEFNVKPVSLRLHRNEITVFGQISHHLSHRKDDQHWFSFKKIGNRIQPDNPTKMVVEKEEGGVAQTIQLARSAGISLGNFFGVDASKFFDTLERYGSKFPMLDFDEGFERAEAAFLQSLAQQLTPPKSVSRAGLVLYEHDNHRGKNTFIQVNKNVKHLKKTDFNDRASSLLARVPDGKKLELFKHDNYKGTVLELGPGSHIIRDLKIHRLGDEFTSVRWS